MDQALEAYRRMGRIGNNSTSQHVEVPVSTKSSNSLMEAYSNIKTNSKNMMNETTGSNIINRINALSVSLIHIRKELTDWKIQEEEELHDLSEEIRKNLNHLKLIVENNTGL